jgi:hypothetical protein
VIADNRRSGGRLYVRRTAGLDERKQAMLKLDNALGIE